MSLTALTKTPGGVKGSCAADVVGIDPVTKQVVEIHQVGVQTKGGLPVARERAAFNDILDFGTPTAELDPTTAAVEFHPHKMR